MEPAGWSGIDPNLADGAHQGKQDPLELTGKPRPKTAGKVRVSMSREATKQRQYAGSSRESGELAGPQLPFR
jgi:hypothetical protein